MKALRIVKGFNVIKKQRLDMIAIERDLVVETFALESRPKTFHDGVIVTIAFPAHAGLNLIAIQEPAEVAGSVLNASIGVMQRDRPSDSCW